MKVIQPLHGFPLRLGAASPAKSDSGYFSKWRLLHTFSTKIKQIEMEQTEDKYKSLNNNMHDQIQLDSIIVSLDIFRLKVKSDICRP